jgi:hypothetical protein
MTHEANALRAVPWKYDADIGGQARCLRGEVARTLRLDEGVNRFVKSPLKP